MFQGDQLRKTSLQHHTKGFTLLEMLMYVAVIALVIGAVSIMLVWGIRMQARSRIVSEVAFQGQRAMEIMTEEIAQAWSVYTPTSLFGVSPGQLSLQTVSVSSSRENFGYIDFFRCGIRLCFKREGSEPIALTTENVSVDNLTFNFIDATGDYDSVQIILTLRYNTLGQQSAYQGSASFQSSAAIRVPK